MKPITSEINLDLELNAIVEFIKLKWTPIECLHDILKIVRDQAIFDARTWVDAYDVRARIDELKNNRRNAIVLSEEDQRLGIKNTSACFYDGQYRSLFIMSAGFSEMADCLRSIDGRWLFDRKAASVEKLVLTNFPDFSEPFPKDWATLENDPDEWAGQAENDPDEWAGQADYDVKADETLFQGSKVETYNAVDFVSTIALPYVRYGKFSQGRSLRYALISGVYSHFLSITEYLNTQRLIRALDKLPLTTTSNLALDFEYEVENPFLILMKPQVPQFTNDDYLLFKKNYIKDSALSEEEKNQIRKEIMSSMTSNVSLSENKLIETFLPEQDQEKVNAEMLDKARKLFSKEYVGEVFSENMPTSFKVRPKM